MKLSRKAQIIEDYIAVLPSIEAVARHHCLSQATVRGILTEYMQPVETQTVLQSAVNLNIDEYIKQNWSRLTRKTISRNVGINESAVKYHALKIGLPIKARTKNGTFGEHSALKVYDSETKRVYESAAELAREIGKTRAMVGKYCRGVVASVKRYSYV